MIDDFLTQFQVQPRETFAAGLYHRLAMQRPARAPMVLRHVGLGFAAACAVLAMVLVVSPTVRAQVGELVYHIAGYRIGVVAQVEHPEDIAMSKQQAADLATAEKALGQAIALPTFLPAGFEGESKLTLSSGPGPMGLNVLWTHKDATLGNDEKYLALGIARGLRDAQLNMVHAKPITVEVSGKPALLAQDVWTLETDANGKITGKTLQTKAKILIWQVGDLDYSISAGPNVSVEDMIRMAESVK